MEERILIRRPENPAKAFLSRYKYLCIQQESLQRSIQAAHDRALSCTVRLKPIKTQGGCGAYDRLAEDIAGKLDAEEQLSLDLGEISKDLSEIRAAINSLQSEAQKTVLTLRYIEGLDWLPIAERIGYEISNTYIIHGRALVEVNKWLTEHQ
jgi:DNA-directed RNA polymerase specialized sigma24 family protein